ncbi:MAG: TorF family putative porin [Desulfarculus sp.]|nr:TorF family putative porin [Pseudomonadota bacterium]MBV1717796.1 TorF family putative porin [Desulfarculus sp.]MBU4576786.1 TorF family putative porin [Pseudomonadota bacterium]MBU4596794.1 TorF family putative porin [Pseudomonadota bacterium]MBV1740438.1 TorF family putative porin [Desulfarculus sp.]
MKKLALTLILAICMALPMGLASATTAQAKLTPTLDAEVAFNSKYVWRGIVVVDDWVAQPSITAGLGGFSFNVWVDYMLTDENDRRNEIDEIDLTLDYTFELGKFSIPVGVIRYTFPNSDVGDTTELYAGVSYDWIVTPSITIYKDVQESNGYYILGALDYSLDLPKLNETIGWSLAVGASIGYGSDDNNSFYYGSDKSGFTDYSLYVSLPFGIGEYVTLTPQVVFTGLVDSDIKDSMEPIQDENNIYFGLVVGASF